MQLPKDFPTDILNSVNQISNLLAAIMTSCVAGRYRDAVAAAGDVQTAVAELDIKLCNLVAEKEKR